MKFTINHAEVNLEKKDLVKLEYHCTDVIWPNNPYLLIHTTTNNIKVEYATELRPVYEYFSKNNLVIENY